MINHNRFKRFACIALLTFACPTLVFAEVAAAEEAATEQAGQAEANQTKKPDPAETLKPAQEIRREAGLEKEKLSVVFEQFVPSETISADNAVPFPTDI